MELARGAQQLVHELLNTAKVVIIEGGRGVGKTTLARNTAEQRSFRTFFDLSDPADRSALAQDAHRVIAAAARPILIDEAQLEPELPVAVKRLVDKDAQPGQVLMTGSARIGRGALGGGDPLAGRAVRLRLHSFTQGELAGTPINAIESWWTADPPDVVHPEVDLPELYTRMILGGLPAVAITPNGTLRPDTVRPDTLTPHEVTARAATAINDDQWRRTLSTYVEGVLTMAVAGTRLDHGRLLQTFRYLAANPAQILNISRAASELAIRAESVRGYLDTCQANFLLDTAPAHRPSQHQTVTAHPRVFAADTALAAWAAETSRERLMRDTMLSGSLLENFVAAELAAQASWTPSPPTLLHWRDSRAAREVDLVLRHPDGRTLAIEVKTSSTVSAADAKGIRAFAEAAGDDFVRGFVIYTGRVARQLDDQIWALPVTSLYATPLA